MAEKKHFKRIKKNNFLFLNGFKESIICCQCYTWGTEAKRLKRSSVNSLILLLKLFEELAEMNFDWFKKNNILFLKGLTREQSKKVEMK